MKKVSLFSKLSSAGIFLTIFFLPLIFVSSVRSSFDLPKEIFLYISLSCIFIFTLFHILQTRSILQKRTVFDYPFLILSLYTILASSLSLNPNISFWGRSDTFVLHFFALFLFIIWAWFLIQLVRTEKFFHQLIFCFLSSGLVASGIFLMSDISFFSQWFSFEVSNPVSKINSIFGFSSVLFFILSLGILIPKNKKHVATFFVALLCFVFSFFSIVRLDFQILWIFMCIGLALLFLLSMAFWGRVRKFFLGITFFLFLFSLLQILLPHFLDWGKLLPTEITLNSSISLNFTEESLTQSTKTFLFGSGPGTFSYVFSLFRPAEFNNDPYFWGVRFDTPFHSLFAFIIEFGFIGTILFLLIILLVLGSILSSILHIRSTLWKESLFHLRDTRFEYFVFMIGFLLLTSMLFFHVFNFTLWFFWWTLLAFVIIGLSYIQPSLIREEKKTFEINPQYVFVFSFFFLILSAFTVIGAVRLGKLFVAERLVYKAQAISEASQGYLKQALEYQPRSAEYMLLLARNYFESSSKLATQNPAEAARFLSLSIDMSRLALEKDPYNIKVLELLSSSYMQTLPYIKENPTSESILPMVDIINRAISLEPTNPLFYSELGVLYEISGQFELSEKSYKKAIDLKFNYIQGYFDLARLYEKQNKIDNAITLFEQYLQKDGSSPDMFYELGRLYYNRKQKGDLLQAEKFWLQSIEIEPKFSNALYSLGLLYEKKGDVSRAKQYFYRVLEINPENTDIQRKIQNLQ